MATPSWSTTKIASLLVVGFFVALPLAGWLELSTDQVWTAPLAWPNFLSEPNRHTAYHDLGTFLPPQITKDTTLTPAQNPILLRGTVTVPAGVTLTIAPGTEIWTFEFSTLQIAGQLHSLGTTNQPIKFVTNEQNEANQTWDGLIFNSGSHGEFSYTHLEHGSPAISCLTGSQVTIAHSMITYGSLGIYNQASACHVSDTKIEAKRTIQNV